MIIKFNFFMMLVFFSALLQASIGKGIDLNELDGVKQWYKSYTSGDSPSVSPIEFLKKCTVFYKELSQDACVTEGYTIEEHTERVIARFEYFKKSVQLPPQVQKKDFVLFLSLHDIGKSLAKKQAAEGLYNTECNQKRLELMYSRRMLKSVAHNIGVDPKTVKILSRLLHSDTIGEYLKELYPDKSAYLLIVRDALKCNLEPDVFFKLHVLFHKVDAGSYPTLKDLFDDDSLEYNQATQSKIITIHKIFEINSKNKNLVFEKWKNLFVDMDEYNKLSAKKINCKKNFGEKYWKDNDYLALDEQSENLSAKINDALKELGETFYQLRLTAYYSKNYADIKWILQLLQDNKSVVEDYSNGELSGLQYDLSEFKRIVDERDISGFHGANSGVLIGLIKTSATLYPTGTLTKLGITPLSGELEIGAAQDGVNVYNISGSTPDFLSTSCSYADSYHVTLKGLVENINKYMGNIKWRRSSDPSLKEQNTIDLFTDQKKDTGQYYQYMDEYCLNLMEGTNRLAFTIKQLTALSSEHSQLLSDLRTLLENDLKQFRRFQETAYYTKQMPKELGGTRGNSYYSYHYLGYCNGLEKCIEHINKPSSIVSKREMEILAKPFPVLFATSLPWQKHQYGDEINFAGQLTLGKEVTYVFVPKENIEYVQQWVEANVPGKKKPKIMEIESLKKEYFPEEDK